MRGDEECLFFRITYHHLGLRIQVSFSVARVNTARLVSIRNRLHHVFWLCKYSVFGDGRHERRAQQDHIWPLCFIIFIRSGQFVAAIGVILK